jgi:hypothetical protein
MFGRKKERVIYGKLAGEAWCENRRENLCNSQAGLGRLRHVGSPLTTFIFLADH